MKPLRIRLKEARKQACYGDYGGSLNFSDYGTLKGMNAG
jgi:hypothetical protein